MRMKVLLLGLALIFAFSSGSAHAQSNRLKIGTTSEATSLDPRFATDVHSLQRVNVMFEPLVSVDRSLGLQPRLATAWQISEDGLTLTFELRPGVEFHHGRVFSSEDVRKTFEWILDPENSALNRSLYTNIDSIETPDDLTVVMHLNAVNAFLINNIAQAPIVPADLAADVEAFALNPSGTGPYVFDNWVRDARLVLHRHDSYWGGAGEIEFIEFHVITENATRLLAFEAGEIDITQGQLPTSELSRLEADERFVLDRTPAPAYTYLGFNLRSPPFDDVRVRQALSHLIPREALVQRLLNGNAFPGISMLPPSSAWFNPDVRRYDYDPELARELLAEASVTFERPLRLFTNDNSVRIQIAEVLEFEFSQIGLPLEVTIEEFGAFNQRILTTEDYDLYILGWGAQLDPDRAMIRQFHSGEFGTSNNTYYANSRVDELLELGRRTDPGSEASIAIYQEASAIVVEEAPFAFLFYTEETALYHAGIEGWTVHPASANTYQDAHLITRKH